MAAFSSGNTDAHTHQPLRGNNYNSTVSCSRPTADLFIRDQQSRSGLPRSRSDLFYLNRSIWDWILGGCDGDVTPRGEDRSSGPYQPIDDRAEARQGGICAGLFYGPSHRPMIIELFMGQTNGGAPNI